MEINCARCGKPFLPRQSTSRFCSRDCRQKAQRSRSRGEPESVVRGDAQVVHLPGDNAPASVVAATRAELGPAGRLHTYLGQAALAAAERVDSARAVQGYAALLKEYRDTMREAMEDVEHDVDALDEIRASAALKLIAGGTG